ncbi:hypothetical protein NOF04DRAFT_1386583 [Fusarium oxysporum II5]|nr:hypothetical protein NOF04DRAFT_1386583 [Fusarium oxysporum II5]
MPARLPDVSGLLALLDRFRTPKRSGLPGGSATEEEIAFAEKDSPIKGNVLLRALGQNSPPPPPPPPLLPLLLFLLSLSPPLLPPPSPSRWKAQEVASPLLLLFLFIEGVIDLTVAFASPQIQDTVELPLHTPCRFVFAAAVNLSLFWVPEVAGFASPLMVAVSHPVQAHAGRRLRLSFDGRPVPTHAGGFASPLMTPLPLLYPSFGKQLAT